VLPLLLIDTRDHPPEPDPERGPSALDVLSAALGWLYPWPMVLIWLFVATCTLEGLAGAITGYVMLGVAFWRMLHVIPADGLSSHQQ
jgi:hypothetical protein